MKSYTKKEIVEITGLTPRQVQFYTEEHIVSADIDEGKGRGHIRRYSRQNVLEFLIIKELNNYGMTLQYIKLVVDWVKSDYMKKKIPELEKQYDKGTRAYTIFAIDPEKRLGMIDFQWKSGKPSKHGHPLYMGNVKKYSTVLVVNFSELVRKAERE